MLHYIYLALSKITFSFFLSKILILNKSRPHFFGPAFSAGKTAICNVMRLATPYETVSALALLSFTNGLLLPRALPHNRASIGPNTRPTPFFRINSAIQVGAATPRFLSPSLIVETLPSAVSLVSNTVPSTLVQSVCSTLISTIDSDIASIPTDEFGKVFAGGVFLMFTGAISALIVGLILEYGNSYDKIALDSYMQNEDLREDFLTSLSAEDRVKAEAVLAKMEITTDKRKDGGKKLSISDTSGTTMEKRPEMSLFSDYED